MRLPMYTPEQLKKIREAAKAYAEFIRGPEDEVMETLVGACYVTTFEDVDLAVIVVHQDKNGPLFQGGT